MGSRGAGIARPRALVVAGCLVAMFITAPGQTFVISTFSEALSSDLGLSLDRLGLAYLIGTLSSAICLTGIGGVADRIGPRVMIGVASVGLAGAGLALQSATGFVTLTLAFFLLRLTGQGAISLASSHALALRFDASLGRMEGLRGATVALAIATVPQLSVALIASEGWRFSAVALTVSAAALGIVASVFMIDRDPSAGSGGAGEDEGWSRSFDLAAARRTPVFWVLISLVAAQAAIVTAVHFHLLPILAESGTGAREAARTYMTYAGAGLGATLLGGVLADRVQPGPLLAASMVLLGLGAAVLELWAGSLGSHVAMGTLGVAQGIGAATHGPTLARYFGRRHHGAIRGAAGTAAVAGSAVAPWATAALMERSGSFGAPLLMMGLAAGALGLLCGLVRRPKPRGWAAE
jgi:OFA family oxalate/formate antiporter-like MFS transporter